MTTRQMRSAVAGSVLSFAVVALVPLNAAAQGASIPDEGGPITLVGCFTKGVIGKSSKERFVLAKPIVGSMASVPEATCAASSGDQMIKLQDLKQVHLGDAQMGRWLEINGRLEGSHRKDTIREVHVKSFSVVPVVVPPPKVAEVTPAPEPAPNVEAPFTPPAVAEVAPTPEPAPIATSGVKKARKHLPKTATSLPLVGLLGFLSLAVAIVLHLFRRRDLTVA